MKLPVILGAAAVAELRDHLARVAMENPATARHLNDEIGITFDLISEFPQLYERFDGDLRRAVLKRWVAAILDLRRAPAAIPRGLGLHEGAAEFLAKPGLAPPSAPALA